MLVWYVWLSMKYVRREQRLHLISFTWLLGRCTRSAFSEQGTGLGDGEIGGAGQYKQQVGGGA